MKPMLAKIHRTGDKARKDIQVAGDMLDVLFLELYVAKGNDHT